jgi:DNA-directed RNA polymerase specialized sigma subunit
MRIASDEIPSALRRLLDRKFDINDPAVVPIWASYLRDRNAADFQWLVEYYLPLVRIIIWQLKRRRPRMFTDDLDVYISDGAEMLMRPIRGRKHSFDPGIWFVTCFKYVRANIYRGRDHRLCGRVAYHQQRRTALIVRSELAGRLGREPTALELGDALRLRVSNPDQYIASLDAPPQRVHRFSELEGDDDGKRPREFEDSRSADPSSRMVNQEIVKLAMRGLDPVDKRILRSVLRGDTAVSVARKLGVSRERIRQRLNRILWQARCRADLAKNLGVCPDPLPPARLANHQYPNFPSNPPPARLAG